MDRNLSHYNPTLGSRLRDEQLKPCFAVYDITWSFFRFVVELCNTFQTAIVHWAQSESLCQLVKVWLPAFGSVVTGDMIHLLLFREGGRSPQFLALPRSGDRVGGEPSLQSQLFWSGPIRSDHWCGWGREMRRLSAFSHSLSLCIHSSSVLHHLTANPHTATRTLMADLHCLQIGWDLAH